MSDIPNSDNRVIVFSKKNNKIIPIHTRSGIRTHEAYAADLKSAPFDRSGILVLNQHTNKHKTMIQIINQYPFTNKYSYLSIAVWKLEMLIEGLEPSTSAL